METLSYHIPLSSNETTVEIFINQTTSPAMSPNISHNATDDYAQTFLTVLNEHYRSVHGYCAITVCMFGLVSNILNIIVLTRKHMATPTNMILTALAISDMLTMTPYIVYAFYLYIITSPECKIDMGMYHTEPWMWFVILTNCCLLTFHTISSWLTVSLAVFRYIFVCAHQHASTMCSMRRAKITILIVYGTGMVLSGPYYGLYKAEEVGLKPTKGYPHEPFGPCYMVAASDFTAANPWMTTLSFWMFGVVIKIGPCLVLVYLSTLLILAMQRAKKRRARLLNSISRVTNQDSEGEHNRTTMMLVAVVLCFVITEMPQGIVAWIAGLNDDFFAEVYTQLGDLMDILVLVNSSFNFILYCIMSQQFRDTFKSLFVMKHLPFLHRVSQTSRTSRSGVDGEYSLVKTGGNGEYTMIETTNV